MNSKIKISMTTAVLSSKLGDEGALDALHNAGFEAADYSGFKYGVGQEFNRTNYDFLEKYKGLGQYARNIGIDIHQTHSPMPMYSLDKEKLKIFSENTLNAIYASAYMGAEYIVFHPAVVIPGVITEEIMRRGAEITIEHYSAFIPVLKENGIKGAIENIYSRDKDTGSICPTVCSLAEDMAYVSDTLGECFYNCLDVGHAYLTKQNPAQMIRQLSDKIGVLHVHDNDGINDCHTAPFEKNILWDDVIDALRDINYKGTLNFEADEFLRNTPCELFPQRLTYLYDLGRYLADKIQK